MFDLILKYNFRKMHKFKTINYFFTPTLFCPFSIYKVPLVCIVAHSLDSVPPPRRQIVSGLLAFRAHCCYIPHTATRTADRERDIREMERIS